MRHILSLGAGVQSSCLALMAAKGEVGPMPEAAIFADTQAEPAEVYDWLDWLETQLPFPLHRVTKGSLTAGALDKRTAKKGHTYLKVNLPYFTKGVAGEKGMMPGRSCTVDYKIEPIRKLLKDLAGIERGQKTVSVTQWIGISLDEVVRMKDSRDVWCKNRWPLIEQSMTRHDCLRWMEANSYPIPPRSACVYCPFHDDHEWRRLRDEMPKEFQRAVDFEKAVQEGVKGGRLNATPYLHAQRVPLDKVDFSTDVDKGQGLLWGNECEGMCGV